MWHLSVGLLTITRLVIVSGNMLEVDVSTGRHVISVDGSGNCIGGN